MSLEDKSGNNILHLAAELPPSSRLNIVSGAALQMQRELLWFKEVEKILLPSDVQKKNINKKTPRELFTDEHKELQVAGEKWMKDTATSCMVVATLLLCLLQPMPYLVGFRKERGLQLSWTKTSS
ncbi:uncharacterized protein LOC111376960 [Olea europaea var. sylvestris]|nr:uncharacterized protein LOC111376960 [Olea europaea var. sylvestris]